MRDSSTSSSKRHIVKTAQDEEEEAWTIYDLELIIYTHLMGKHYLRNDLSQTKVGHDNYMLMQMRNSHICIISVVQPPTHCKRH